MDAEVEGEGHPTRAGDAVRAFVQRQFGVDVGALAPQRESPTQELLLEVTPAAATVRELPPVVLPTSALIENNLARKGVWSCEPNRSRQEFRFVGEDVVGSLLVDYSLGQLSVADMRVVAWLLGRWRADEEDITFTFRGCARDMGLTWGGSRDAALRDQLTRIHRTRMTARVFNALTGKHQEVLFGILDLVEITDRRSSFDGAPEDASVRVRLSSFIADNLGAGHFVRLRWPILASLRPDLAQRLYVYLESQKGYFRDGANMYEVTLDERLQTSLGSGDRPRRFRVKLATAGERICAADCRYQGVTIRPGKTRGAYVLSVRRAAA